MQVDSAKFKQLCYASIIDYLKAKQIPFESNGQKGYYHLKDHDSLVVVAAGTGHYQTDTFFWNSRGLSGNLYRFITEYLGIPKGKFVDEVLATLGNDAGPSGELTHDHETPFDESKWADTGYHQQVATFLEKQCAFSPALVDRLFDLDLLRQLSNGDGALMWRDSPQKIVGASQLFIQYQEDQLVTRTCRDSKHYYGFNFGCHYHPGDNYTLLVFEDPLRALAYYRLLVESGDTAAYRFLSVGGSGTRLPAIVNYIKDWGCPQAIRLCVDNSDAGLIMAAKFYADYQGNGDTVTFLVDKQQHQVQVSFDQAKAAAGNFLRQYAEQAGGPQEMTYQQFLAAFDQSRHEGAAQQLVETTPGIGSSRDQGEPTTDQSTGKTVFVDFDDLDLPF
ncbi:hypothetical protein [uncultured Limosilactobacillus sp.]|uniref:hypothetical protein n=1 Tax=uncultured Limosilactobacillus sp. TaxID=2837629 RepID=UPI0025D4197D|nr:hypothetical protein [uncultured Limosilactobacillus sp.]